MSVRAARAGVSIEEYIIYIAARGLDPDEAAEKYLAGAKQLLEEARRELEKGDLREDLERLRTGYQGSRSR